MTDREADIRALLPLVRRIARRLSGLIAGTDLDDLIGDGSIGCVRAVDTFDPSFGVTLEQYARRVIVGAMLNGIRRLDPVSERVRRTIREADRERYLLANEAGALPTIAEMEQRIPKLRRARTEAYRATPVSIDAPLTNRDAVELIAGDDPAQSTVDRQEAMRLRALLADLPERERQLIERHYFASHSLRRLSIEMNVSPQRVSQLHRSALGRLRTRWAIES